MLNVVKFDQAGACTILTQIKKKMCVYSLYSYFDVPNTVKESITNSMFKITLNVRVLLKFQEMSRNFFF